MRVFAAMMDAPQHTYVLLTKRPDIMFRDLKTWTVSPNWWLLTSVTNQDDADKRIPQLLPLRDAGWLTGVSVEPLLGPVRRMVTQLGWVIIGAQTGPGATVPKEKWVSDMLHECKLGQVPVFVKDNVGWSETIREFPKGDQT
jgi:protein gp37